MSRQKLPERLRETLRKCQESHGAERKILDDLLGRPEDDVMCALERKLMLLKEEMARKDKLLRDANKERAKMKGQIHEMEKFLADYGLVWVGEQTDAVNFARKLQELSSRARAQVVLSGKTAQFKMIRERIVVYRDGFVLRNSFRPFRDSEGFVKDVNDGFFPSEFKSSHPDGVPFDVIDKTSEMYSFGGFGRKLGKQIVVNQQQQHSPRQEEWLGSRNKETQAGAASDNKTRSEYEATTIRVRDTDDGERLVVSMRGDETVGDLREKIDALRKKNTPYEIRRAHFQRSQIVDENHSKTTLREAGLVPNATIYLQRR